MGGQYGSKRAIAPEREHEVIELYERDHSTERVGIAFGVSSETIRRILKRNGVPRRKRKEPKVSTNPKKGIDAEQVGELYRAGVTTREIAQQLGCKESTIYYHLKKLGLYKPKWKKTPEETIDEIACKYLAGASTGELSKEYGVSPGTISEWMRKRGYCLGKGSKSDKGGKATALIHLQKRIERFSAVADKIELLESVNKDHNKVRCLECGTVYNWHEGSWTIDIPCPTCRERAKQQERERKDYEREQQKEAIRARLLSTPRICKECWGLFYSEYEDAVYCSEKCKRRAKRRRKKERDRLAGIKPKTGGKRDGYKRRMRIVRTPSTYDRTIDLNAVYAKYHGICCECGCKTVRSNEYRPDRATLDHIIALANNGTHTWDNVQLLCATCNSNKRDLGQMRLPIAI